MNTTKQLDMRHTTKQPLNNMFSGRPAGFFLTKISVFMCKDYSFYFYYVSSSSHYHCSSSLWRVSSSVESVLQQKSLYLLTPWDSWPIRPFEGLRRLFKGLIRPFKEPYKAL